MTANDETALVQPTVGSAHAAVADTDRFSRAIPIADAILWEGYVLYPYRSSAAKNRLRFNWGVVGPAEERSLASTVVVEADRVDHLHVRARFLHLLTREDGWDEAEPVCCDLTVGVEDIMVGPIRSAIDVPSSVETGSDGRRRAREALHGSVTVSGTRHHGHLVVSVEVQNTTPAADRDVDRRGTETFEDVDRRGDGREMALRRSFVGCHLLLAADDDIFVSALEPPAELEDLVESLVQHRAWPVLVGPEPRRDLVLASPVILYDYPAVAEQSAGEFYDSTEIDEMLALRVHTLTSAEKAEARALDPRARAIIDRHDTLEPELMAELHGTTGRSAYSEPSVVGSLNDPSASDPASVDGSSVVGSSIDPSASDPSASDPSSVDGSSMYPAPVDPNPEWSEPGPARVLAAGRWIEPGSKVRLEPAKRADVHDMFLRGRVATVAEIVHDVDGDIHVAVTVDDDPAADLFRAQRRYLYFAPDEVAPLGVDDD